MPVGMVDKDRCCGTGCMPCGTMSMYLAGMYLALALHIALLSLHACSPTHHSWHTLLSVSSQPSPRSPCCSSWLCGKSSQPQRWCCHVLLASRWTLPLPWPSACWLSSSGCSWWCPLHAWSSCRRCWRSCMRRRRRARSDVSGLEGGRGLQHAQRVRLLAQDSCVLCSPVAGPCPLCTGYHIHNTVAIAVLAPLLVPIHS